MQGFPASAESQVTLSNWRTPPFNKWGFQHVREIVPSADIAAAQNDTMPLPADPIELNSLKIDDGAGNTLPFARFLEHSHTDGMSHCTTTDRTPANQGR